jgi:hypothetical protein
MGTGRADSPDWEYPPGAAARSRSSAGIFPGNVLVEVQHFRDLTADFFYRIEGCHGILKNHRDFIAADFAQLPFRHFHQILAMEQDFAADDFPGAGYQTHDRHGHDTFATAGFTDDANRFATLNFQVDSPNRLNRPTCVKNVVCS